MAGRGQFEAFWDRTHDPVTRAVALTVGDVQLAAEATDEAMVRAYQRWDRVAGLEDPAGWVYRVACNWATSWRRKMVRRPTRDREQLDRVVSDAYPDLDLIRACKDWQPSTVRSSCCASTWTGRLPASLRHWT